MKCPRCQAKMQVTNTVIADQSTVARRYECQKPNCLHVINSVEFIISTDEPPRKFGVRSLAKGIREGEIQVPKMTIQNGKFSTVLTNNSKK